MHGTIEVPFFSLFTDTVNAHGSCYAYEYYVRKHGMKPWEFRFWMRKLRRCHC